MKECEHILWDAWRYVAIGVNEEAETKLKGETEISFASGRANLRFTCQRVDNDDRHVCALKGEFPTQVRARFRGEATVKEKADQADATHRILVFEIEGPF